MTNYLAGIATSTLEAKCLSLLLLLRLVLKEKSSSSQLQNLTLVIKTRSQKVEEKRKLLKGDDIFFNLFPICKKMFKCKLSEKATNTFVAHFNPLLLLKTQLAVTSEPRQVINYLFSHERDLFECCKTAENTFFNFFEFYFHFFSHSVSVFFTRPERAFLITFS